MTGTPGTSGPEQAVADPRDYVQDGLILIGCSKSGRDLAPECIELALANRHGLVTGATGTGKTVTLQVLAEGFSAAGVPVFAADIKGDLSGIAAKGEPTPKLVERAEEIGLTRYGNTSFPTVFWDIFGVDGHPVRATVQEMGPLLLSRLMELTEPQEGVLNIAFRWAAGRARSRRRENVDPRSQGSALRHRRDGQARRHAAEANTDTSRRRRSASSSAGCSCSKSRAPPSSSASRLSTSWIS